MHLYSAHSFHTVMKEEMGWMNTAHVAYFHSHWAFSFHSGMNLFPLTARVESICEWRGDNLLLNNSGVCMWVTGPYQSSRLLIKVERGSGWIKDQLIKMSSEHASPHFIYHLKPALETEKWDVGEAWNVNKVCWTSSDAGAKFI